MKTRRYFLIVMSLVSLFLLGLSPACTVDKNKVKPGEFVIEPPTLISHGFEWHIENDDNRNAAVKVSYRKKGAGSTNYYIADNTVLGRDDPTRLIGWISKCAPWSTQSGYLQRIAGHKGFYYGITVGGQGHVVCHNRVAHFHDAIATDQAAGPPQEG